MCPGIVLARTSGMSKPPLHSRAYGPCILTSLLACSVTSPQRTSPVRDAGKRSTVDASSGSDATPGAAPLPTRVPRNHLADDAGVSGGPGGNCQFDSDCGPDGYCSPSIVNKVCACWALAPECDAQGSGTCIANGVRVPCECDVCGHGSFCHTKNDTCIDNADCGITIEAQARNGTCNYNKFEARWSCSVCQGLPTPGH